MGFVMPLGYCCLPTTLSQAVEYDYVDARTGVAAYLSEFVSFEDEEFTAFWNFVWDKSGGWFFQALLAFIQGTFAGNSTCVSRILTHTFC